MRLHLIIKNLREEKQLTQEQLAVKAGLTRGYISRLEAGDYSEGSPSIKTLQMISEGLSVSIDSILKEAGITKEAYLKTPSLELVLRAKNLSEGDIEKVKQYISSLKKHLRENQE